MTYKLLKDLPYIKAGTLFKFNPIFKNYTAEDETLATHFVFTQKEITAMTDWFSPLFPTAPDLMKDWKPVERIQTVVHQADAALTRVADKLVGVAPDPAGIDSTQQSETMQGSTQPTHSIPAAASPVILPSIMPLPVIYSVKQLAAKVNELVSLERLRQRKEQSV